MMLSDMDINAIAGTLKLYFRELPEPLLTDKLYLAFMEGIGMCLHSHLYGLHYSNEYNTFSQLYL